LGVAVLVGVGVMVGEAVGVGVSVAVALAVAVAVGGSGVGSGVGAPHAVNSSEKQTMGVNNNRRGDIILLASQIILLASQDGSCPDMEYLTAARIADCRQP